VQIDLHRPYPADLLNLPQRKRRSTVEMPRPRGPSSGESRRGPRAANFGESVHGDASGSQRPFYLLQQITARIEHFEGMAAISSIRRWMKTIPTWCWSTIFLSG